jgi:tRNA splicing ligase
MFFLLYILIFTMYYCRWLLWNLSINHPLYKKAIRDTFLKHIFLTATPINLIHRASLSKTKICREYVSFMEGEDHEIIQILFSDGCYDECRFLSLNSFLDP